MIVLVEVEPEAVEALTEMNLEKRRDRMVSIRLSDEELRQLRGLCEITGARTISDLARDAMQKMLRDQVSPAGAPVLLSQLEELHGRMSDLQEKVERLSAMVGS